VPTALDLKPYINSNGVNLVVECTVLFIHIYGVRDPLVPICLIFRHIVP